MDARKISALEAMEQMLVEELTFRETRRIKTVLMLAKFTAAKTLTDFDFGFQPWLDKKRITGLAELTFIQRCETLHFLAPPGSGKSHLALALGVEAVTVAAGQLSCRLHVEDLSHLSVRLFLGGHLSLPELTAGRRPSVDSYP